MFTLLFDSGFWYDLMFISVAIVLIYLCFKYKSAKWILLAVTGIALIGFTAFCGIELNSYYSADGGIFGYISGIVETNKVTTTITDNVEFSFTNVVLTQETNSETYSAKIYLNDIIELDESKSYTVFVNKEPSSNVVFSAGTTSYVRSQYSYSFLDDNLNSLCNDILTFNFAFFDKGTEIKISTQGGQAASDYWRKYFTRNNFIVEIKSTNYTAEDDLSFTDGDISNYCTLTYWVDGSEYMTQVFDINQKVTLIDGPYRAGYTFSHWQDTEGNIYSSIAQFSMNKDLLAVFEENEILFSGKQKINLGASNSLLKGNYTLSLSNKMDIDISAYSSFEVKFDFVMYCYDEPGLATGAPGGGLAFVEGDSYVAGRDGVVWLTCSLQSNANICFEFTEAYIGYYGYITITEIIGILN